MEILVNEPYKNGPGGHGQYTRKIYHVGSHLPGWLKGILPKTALMVEEEAWNAYPYTKTRYTCPFVEKFYLEIETYYYSDNGHQENVFGLSGTDIRNRIVGKIMFFIFHYYYFHCPYIRCDRCGKRSIIWCRLYEGRGSKILSFGKDRKGTIE